MKMKKGLIVSSLSTAMAVSMVAGIAGTIAWYQFNTRVSTTIIGTSVANTGVLQIRKFKESAPYNDWGRDLVTADLIGDKIEMSPVTFGALNEDGSLPGSAYMKGHADSVWDQPENERDAWDPSGYNSYENAAANVDYIQYSVEIRAMSGGEQVEKDVYLSEITLNDLGGGKISEALRVHLAIDDDPDHVGDDRFVLLSKTETNDLELYGVLDFNDDGIADRKGGAEWVANREKVTFYGRSGETQSTKAASSLVAAKVDGNIADGQEEKILFTTRDDGLVKVTVTVWIEGWDNSIAEFKKDGVKITDAIYRTIEIDPVTPDVSAYFVRNGTNFIKQAAVPAEDGVAYVKVKATEKVITTSALPADTYILNAGNYEYVNGNASQFVTYYSIEYTDASDEIVTPAEVNAELANAYELVNGNYVKTRDDAEHLDGGKQYYALYNSTVNYAEVDGITDQASGSEDVSKYYVKDDSNNYVKPSTHNVKGNAYYTIAPASYNPLINSFANDTFSVVGLFVYDTDHYEAAAGTNDASVHYYLDDQGVSECLYFNDLPNGAFADISGLNLFTMEDDVYSPATGASVHGETYYTLTPNSEDLDAYQAKVGGLYVKDSEQQYVQLGKNAKGTVYYTSNDGTDVEAVAADVESGQQDVSNYYVKVEDTYYKGNVKLPATTYYFKDGNFYYEFNMAEINKILSGKLDLSGLFVLDTDGKYIPVSTNNVKGQTYYKLVDGGTVDNVPMWTGLNSDDVVFHFGLTFDVGRNAFENN